MSDVYTISTDKTLLDVQAIQQYLSERSYWAKGRTIETVRTSIANSLCIGIYTQDNTMVGFGRVLTDYAVFAYIMDVFILEPHRGKGLGKRLVHYMVNLPELKELKRWHLATADAHDLYRRFGFSQLSAPEKFMEKVTR